jgi:hypothetical protein
MATLKMISRNAVYLDECGAAYRDKELTDLITCEQEHEGNGLMRVSAGVYECSQAHVIHIIAREIEQ